METNTIAVADTATFLRIIIIRRNFELCFTRIMKYSEQTASKYIDEIESKNIKQISFWAYKKDGANAKKKCAELIINVNWEMHAEYLFTGNENVKLPNHLAYEKGIVPEISAAINIFIDMKSFFNAEVTFSVYYTDIVLNNPSKRIELNKKLGLVTPDHETEWVGGSYYTLGTYSPMEVKELKGVVNVAGTK